MEIHTWRSFTCNLLSNLIESAHSHSLFPTKDEWPLEFFFRKLGWSTSQDPLAISLSNYIASSRGWVPQIFFKQIMKVWSQLTLKLSLNSFNRVFNASHCENSPWSLTTSCCRSPTSFYSRVMIPSPVIEDRQLWYLWYYSN